MPKEAKVALLEQPKEEPEDELEELVALATGSSGYQLLFGQGFGNRLPQVYYAGIRVCSGKDLEHMLRGLLWLQVELGDGFCIRR